MENIQNAVLSAVEAKPLDFKTHIAAELESKVASALELRKQELAKSFLNYGDEDSEEEIQTEPEETTDEDF
jgi:hypothetical protein